MLKSTRNQILIIGSLLLLAAAVTVVAGVVSNRRESYSVCPECAQIQVVEEWYVPFTEHRLHAATNARPTDLSRLLVSKKYVADHAHRWLFAKGEGVGGHSDFGEGSVIAESLVPPVMAVFASRLFEYTDHSTVTLWLGRMANAENARMCHYLAQECAHTNFTGQEHFQQWLDYREAHPPH